MLLMSLEAFAASTIACRYLRLPFGVGLLSYASGTIVLLYASDFVHLLRPASWALHAAIVIGTVTMAFHEARARFSGVQSRISLKSSIAVLAIVFCAVQAALFCSAKEYAAWDEFSHWGTVIRAIYEANTFHLHPNPLYFQDYPPGLALFAYHAMQLSGYTEPNAYFSYAILIFCFAASIFQLAYRANIIWFFVSLILLWGIVQVVGGGWASVLVDHTLSIYFAGIIGAYFLLRQSEASILVLALSLGAFTLTKQAASSLALLAASIIVVDSMFDCVQRYRAIPSAGLVVLRNGVAVSVVLLAVTVLVPMTWQYYVSTAGVMQGWGSYSPYGGLAKLISCCTTEREVSVATKFFSAFSGAQVPAESAGPLLLIAWKSLTNLSFANVLSGAVLVAPGLAMAALALASLLWMLFLRSTAERLKHLLFSMLMMAGATGYVLSLLTAYLYAYSDYEAETLASFHRFLNVYTVGWMFALLSAALGGVHRGKRWHGSLAAVVALSGLIVALWPGIQTSWPITSQAQLQEAGAVKIEARARIRQWAVADRAKISAGSRVYILWPGTSGLEFWLVKYELLPHMTNLDCFAVIAALPKDIIQECVMSDSELKKTLANYDFVVVGDGMNRLHEEYGDIFPNGPDGRFFLFRVDRSNGLHLTPVED